MRAISLLLAFVSALCAVWSYLVYDAGRRTFDYFFEMGFDDAMYMLGLERLALDVSDLYNVAIFLSLLLAVAAVLLFRAHGRLRALEATKPVEPTGNSSSP